MTRARKAQEQSQLAYVAVLSAGGHNRTAPRWPWPEGVVAEPGHTGGSFHEVRVEGAVDGEPR